MLYKCIAEGGRCWTVTAIFLSTQNADFLLTKTRLKGLHPQNGSPFSSDSNPFYKINLGGLNPEIELYLQKKIRIEQLRKDGHQNRSLEFAKSSGIDPGLFAR